jgi:hypothetical protein
MKRGLLDWEEPMGGLLGGYSPSPDLVDRATFLPVGQYEDGSLTLAWPGFLKDTYDAAQRTYLDAAHVPVPDAPMGTPWSSDLDALTVASAPAVGSVGMKAAGLAVDTAPTYGLKRSPTALELAKNWIEDSSKYGARDATRYAQNSWAQRSDPNNFIFNITKDGRNTGLEVKGTVDDDLAYIDWIGRRGEADDGRIIGVNDPDQNILGIGALRQIKDEFRRTFPEVTRFSGTRVSGARVGAAGPKSQTVEFHANPSTASLPSLGLHAVEAATKTPGIRAYHGSPHDFDKFDSGRINDGLTFAKGHHFHRDETDSLSYRGSGGKMYEVNIAADPDEFLRMSDTVASQPTAARETLERLGFVDQPNNMLDPGKPGGLREAWHVAREAAIKRGQHGPEFDRFVSDELARSGVPGVQLGRGEHLMVLPGNEHLISILRKYGLLGTAGVGSMMFGGEDAQASDPSTQDILREYGLLAP